MTNSGRELENSHNNAKITPGIVLILAVIAISSCRNADTAPDVSHLDGRFELIRTEHVLFSMDSSTASETAKATFDRHKPFWDLYFNTIMLQPEQSPDSVPSDAWRLLVTDQYLRAIQDSISIEFADMSDIDAQLSSAFQYLQYYFPGNRVPNVYTLNSGFGYFPFIFEDGERDGLGISLEMFLGSDFPYRSFAGNAVAFSDYLIRSYNRDHVAKRTIEVLVDDLVGPPPGERLIDQMVHNGIKLYIIEQLMPTLDDTILFEFKPQQLAWCKENERNLWAHFLKDDLLYEDEFGKVQKLVNPAPMIPGLPPEAPGGVANWTGWRIIDAMMKRDPEITLIDLLSVQDPQKILEAANYRPR